MKTPSEAKSLEQFYEQVVLPLYDIAQTPIVWLSHDRIGDDVFAHYFRAADTGYVLVFEDFPSGDHFIAEESAPFKTKQGLAFVQLGPKNSHEYIDNRTGYFSLHPDDPV